MSLPVGDTARDDPAAVVGLQGFGERKATGEQPLLEHLGEGQRPALEPQALRGGGIVGPFGERLDEVAPDLQEGQTLGGTLAPLAEGDGLALVISAAVADEQVEQVDREQWVARGTPGAAGGHVMSEREA